MLFSERKKLVDAYYRWLSEVREKEPRVADTPLTVISFLVESKLLVSPKSIIQFLHQFEGDAQIAAEELAKEYNL